MAVRRDESVSGDPPTWRQSLLLSNGWEVSLHFREVHVEELHPLIPAVPAQVAMQPV